jgi:hypothetical protein
LAAAVAVAVGVAAQQRLLLLQYAPNSAINAATGFRLLVSTTPATLLSTFRLQ